MEAPDLIQIRKMNANKLVHAIADNARWLAKRTDAPYQDSMPALDWEDEQLLRRAVEDIRAALRHDAKVSKRYEMRVSERASRHVMTTYCAECKHVYRVNPRDLPRYWLCTRHKRSEQEMGYIVREFWNDQPPYLYCRDVNHGCCPLFEEAPPDQVNQLKGEMT